MWAHNIVPVLGRQRREGTVLRVDDESITPREAPATKRHASPANIGSSRYARPSADTTPPASARRHFTPFVSPGLSAAHDGSAPAPPAPMQNPTGLSGSKTTIQRPRSAGSIGNMGTRRGGRRLQGSSGGTRGGGGGSSAPGLYTSVQPRGLGDFWSGMDRLNHDLHTRAGRLEDNHERPREPATSHCEPGDVLNLDLGSDAAGPLPSAEWRAVDIDGDGDSDCDHEKGISRAVANVAAATLPREDGINDVGEVRWGGLADDYADTQLAGPPAASLPCWSSMDANSSSNVARESILGSAHLLCAQAASGPCSDTFGDAKITPGVSTRNSQRLSQFESPRDGRAPRGTAKAGAAEATGPRPRGLGARGRTRTPPAPGTMLNGGFQKSLFDREGEARGGGALVEELTARIRRLEKDLDRASDQAGRRQRLAGSEPPRSRHRAPSDHEFIPSSSVEGCTGSSGSVASPAQGHRCSSSGSNHIVGEKSGTSAGGCIDDGGTAMSSRLPGQLPLAQAPGSPQEAMQLWHTCQQMQVERLELRRILEDLNERSGGTVFRADLAASGDAVGVRLLLEQLCANHLGLLAQLTAEEQHSAEQQEGLKQLQLERRARRQADVQREELKDQLSDAETKFRDMQARNAQLEAMLLSRDEPANDAGTWSSGNVSSIAGACNGTGGSPSGRANKSACSDLSLLSLSISPQPCNSSSGACVGAFAGVTATLRSLIGTDHSGVFIERRLAQLSQPQRVDLIELASMMRSLEPLLSDSVPVAEAQMRTQPTVGTPPQWGPQAVNDGFECSSMSNIDAHDGMLNDQWPPVPTSLLGPADSISLLGHGSEDTPADLPHCNLWDPSAPGTRQCQLSQPPNSMEVSGATETEHEALISSVCAKLSMQAEMLSSVYVEGEAGEQEQREHPPPTALRKTMSSASSGRCSKRDDQVAEPWCRAPPSSSMPLPNLLSGPLHLSPTSSFGALPTIARLRELVDEKWHDITELEARGGAAATADEKLASRTQLVAAREELKMLIEFLGDEVSTQQNLDNCNQASTVVATVEVGSAPIVPSESECAFVPAISACVTQIMKPQLSRDALPSCSDNEQLTSPNHGASADRIDGLGAPSPLSTSLIPLSGGTSAPSPEVCSDDELPHGGTLLHTESLYRALQRSR